MRTLLGIIVSIVVDIVGHLINKWLDKVSLSGSWKTLHGMVKRSLISKITSIKKDELQLVFFCGQNHA